MWLEQPVRRENKDRAQDAVDDSRKDGAGVPAASVGMVRHTGWGFLVRQHSRDPDHLPLDTVSRALCDFGYLDDLLGGGDAAAVWLGGPHD